LPRTADVEDAFQTTFLVFLRKAGSIRKADLLGSWLYKVAYRAALAVRSRNARQAERETPLTDAPAPGVEMADDVRPIIDEEVNRLPQKYRVPFILCHVEGMSTVEAARQLGCPQATVGTWLARARDRLRVRLSRRGLAITAAAALANNASASPQLVASTLQAAAGAGSPRVLALTEGVLRAMFLTKVKVAGLALAACSVVLALSAWSFQAVANNPAVDATKAAEITQPLFVAQAAKIDKTPEAMYGFSGELLGKLVSKDAEKGSLVMEVRKVTNVWRGNKASNPRSCVGKTLAIDGVFGKFLDVLVILKEGDGVLIEAKHVRGDNLTFLGELLKRVDLSTYEKKKDD
jgi:RNA polymerase sigma factor (sigma-70 family)